MTKVFDIIVPTYNRYPELPEFFKRNAAIQHAPAQLWVIDDCSTHFDPSAIPKWDNLTFIRLEKNRGQAFIRNTAVEKGRAPYIISLDDDAWFEDVSASFTQLEKLFAENPAAGCIMFNIATPNSDYSKMKTGTVLPLHVTCGCAYRRDVLEQIKGFPGFLHSQAEETDISLRIYQADRNIIFANEVKVFHNFSPGSRSLAWYHYIRYNTTRNDMLIVVMYYPMTLILPFLIGKYISHLVFAVTNKVSIFTTFFHTARAVFGFVWLLPVAVRKRRPMTLQQFKEWRLLLKRSIEDKMS